MYAFLIGFLFSVIYSVIAIVMYNVEKRVLKAEFPAFWGTLWPITMTCYAILAAFICPFAIYNGFVWLIDTMSKKLLEKTDTMTDQLIFKTKRLFSKGNTKVEVNKFRTQQPIISIPCGAAIRSEDYRRLKPMLEQYEATLPVTERE